MWRAFAHRVKTDDMKFAVADGELSLTLAPNRLDVEMDGFKESIRGNGSTQWGSGS